VENHFVARRKNELDARGIDGFLGTNRVRLDRMGYFLLHVANENALENAHQSARESPGNSPECQDCARRNNNSPRPDPALDSEDFVARRCPINWFIRPPPMWPVRDKLLGTNQILVMADLL
jgi:hypothetical protein